jgi:hypothetical protein
MDDRNPDSATTEGDAGVVAASLINLEIRHILLQQMEYHYGCESYDRP